MDTHVRFKDLSVVYTNNPVCVENSIHTMEKLLADDKYKVVNIILEYTDSRTGHDQKVAIAQLCVDHYVLVYHYYLATRPCERFAKFVNNPDYIFSTMDTTNDEKVLKTTGLAYRNLVDIQCRYKILSGEDKHKDSLIDLAMDVIDPCYKHEGCLQEEERFLAPCLGQKTG
ncbi:hypothetical protein D1007_48943 [Hordeum vulgare]|nr:hypothetical protein D1007_48943 [Hordeum vulgare]